MDLESFLAYGILLHHGKSWGINLYKLPKLLTIGCKKNHFPLYRIYVIIE